MADSTQAPSGNQQVVTTREEIERAFAFHVATHQTEFSARLAQLDAERASERQQWADERAAAEQARIARDAEIREQVNSYIQQQAEHMRGQYDTQLAALQAAAAGASAAPPPPPPLPTPTQPQAGTTPDDHGEHHQGLGSTPPQPEQGQSTGPGPQRTARSSVPRQTPFPSSSAFASNTKRGRRPNHPDYLNKRQQAMIPNARPTLKAIAAHYAAATGAISPYAIVPLPIPEDQARLHKRFASVEAMSQHVNSPTAVPDIEGSTVSITSKFNGMQTLGNMAARVHLIDDDTLASIVSFAARASVAKVLWDPRLSSDSLWNRAIDTIIQGSFRRALQNGAYDHLRPNKTLADLSRAADLARLVRHVLHRQGQRTLHDMKYPGVRVGQERMAATYRDRDRLCERRLRVAEQERHKPELLALVRCRRAHSLTRFNPETQRNERCSIPERAVDVTAYFEYLDERDRTLNSGPNVKRNQRPPVREKVTNPPAATTAMLPQDAPLNFFDPSFYNRLSRDVRANISQEIWLAPLPFQTGLKYAYQAYLNAFEEKILLKYIGLDEEAENELQFTIDDEEDVHDSDIDMFD
ncbi:hypothetical protein BKA62DRAFT_678369 [Auriculariales sp. MPI-PUGE-AT-0066]|nr:hypothetical protein BKA62DRAFT_678369 [Auriculariales sp. MPI-PUGE-AT-0066]